MSRINYLLDEHVEHGLRNGLRQREPEMTVWVIDDPHAPPIGALDPEILLWCEAHNFVLVTRNRRTMPAHLRNHIAAGHHIPGIFILNPKRSMGEMIEELVLIWLVAEPDQFTDQITHLPLRS
jgi:hypothetical protein